MNKFLRLEFISASPDVALLVLRVALGLSMIWLHGSGKLMALLGGKTAFADPIGIGQVPSFLLVIFAEVGCSVLLILGLYARWAAFFLLFTMGVAFFVVNHAQLDGKGELPALYLAGYVALFIAGAGKYSLDKK